jgi:putative mRNA 3-end processing factor
MRATDILTPTPAGLYSPLGDFHIDPMRPVARALITHAHSDHARAGHGAVLATADTLAFMAIRLGESHAGTTQAVAYGERIRIGGVEIRFHPAGHVRGSAQIAASAGGFTVVASGDYKREADPTAAPFEPQRCNVFISEATFGLPVFEHPPAAGEVDRLLASVALFPERSHLIGAYSLGKAQRLIALLRAEGYDAPIFLHGALERTTAHYMAGGCALGDLRPIAAHSRTETAGAVVICPPSALSDLWSRRFPDAVKAQASGWMRIRARARQAGVELPLVVSDHAGWSDLGRTIQETGAEEIWITHGEAEALAHWCAGAGIAARALDLVGYGDDGEPAAPEPP